MKKIFILSILVVLSVAALSVTAQTGETYYVKGRTARVRAEPNTTSTVLVTLRSKAAVVVLEVVDGTKVSGSTVWYRIDVNGQSGYVHSSLITNVAPASPVTASGGSSPTLQSTPAPLVEQPVQPQPSGASCNGATTCSQMASCEQARACLAAGRSSLDRDHDGIPCESICGG